MRDEIKAAVFLVIVLISLFISIERLIYMVGKIW